MSAVSMTQPDGQQDQQQVADENLRNEHSTLRSSNQEDVAACWNPSTRNYPTINVGGQAHAILGDVHIGTNDPTFLRDGG